MHNDKELNPMTLDFGTFFWNKYIIYIKHDKFVIFRCNIIDYYSLLWLDKKILLSRKSL